MTLDWGNRFLMCPPTFFDVAYEINPWMHAEVTVDHDKARLEWENLVANLQGAGASVEVLTPAEGVPDIVFTANAGIVNGSTFVPSNFRFPERDAEIPIYVDWFRSNGFEVSRLPEEIDHEGAGDALPFDGVFVSAYRQRSDAAAVEVLSRQIGAPIRAIELTDERFYHVDLTFCPVDERHALCFGDAWDRYGVKVVEALVPEPLWLDEAEATTFCANSVVVDTTIVMPACPPRVGRALESWGLDVAVAPVGEFIKAGGAVRCLTLALDVAVK